MKIFSDKLITEKEAYDAMLYFLELCIESTGSKDITDILSGGEYWLETDNVADSAYWAYWLESIEKMRHQGPPPMKILK